MESEKPQICIIHGGVAFDSDEQYQVWLRDVAIDYDRLLYAPSWKNWLAQQLPDRDVLLPSMPTKLNAKYAEWSLYFSKIIPLLRPDAILIGHSLGGIFLARYLSEHPPAHPFRRCILVAAPYDDESTESLKGFKLDGAAALSLAAQEIHLCFSSDDPLVPLEEKDKYRQDIPDATVHLFTGKQHFNTPTFPELLKLLS